MRTSSDSYLLTVLLVALLVCPPPLMAAVIVVDGTFTLVDAITATNTDTTTGAALWIHVHEQNSLTLFGQTSG